jgi:hypothetical protein
MFEDRKEAGEKLARTLVKYKDKDAYVLAIPKGGVQVGFEIGKGDVAQKHQNSLPRSSFRIAIATAVPPTPN